MAGLPGLEQAKFINSFSSHRAQAGLEPCTACLSAYTLPGLGQPEPISGKAAGHLGVLGAEAGALFTTENRFWSQADPGVNPNSTSL